MFFKGIAGKKIIQLCMLVLGFYLSQPVFAQSNNYWLRSFNEESSLLSGAVVGGGAGPSAIYYNPASISEITQSKLTLNASLFSFDFINVKNALGDGLGLKSSRGVIEPRFLSYMVKLKKIPAWSFEIAFLNNENTKLDLINAVDEEIDILTETPGPERYYAIYQYGNNFRDDWIGIGGSVQVHKKIFVGLGLFGTIKSCNNSNLLNIDAISLSDSVVPGSMLTPRYIATYQDNFYLKFNDYRILFKAGIMYKTNSLSLGLSVTSPSFHIYSDGKRVTRSERSINITNSVT